jgi:hypothetical protein
MLPTSATHTDIVTVATVIQLAVAPVFLLTGIAGLLGVMANRLGRITDRARVLERRLAGVQRAELVDTLNQELGNLWRRSRLINWALSLGTLGALLVCVVIVTLFIGDVSQVDLSGMIVLLFVGAMCAVIGALLFFIREVYVATATVRMGVDSLVDDTGQDEH